MNFGNDQWLYIRMHYRDKYSQPNYSLDEVNQCYTYLNITGMFYNSYHFTCSHFVLCSNAFQRANYYSGFLNDFGCFFITSKFTHSLTNAYG